MGWQQPYDSIFGDERECSIFRISYIGRASKRKSGEGFHLEDQIKAQFRSSRADLIFIKIDGFFSRFLIGRDSSLSLN